MKALRVMAVFVVVLLVASLMFVTAICVLGGQRLIDWPYVWDMWAASSWALMVFALFEILAQPRKRK